MNQEHSSVSELISSLRLHVAEISAIGCETCLCDPVPTIEEKRLRVRLKLAKLHLLQAIQALSSIGNENENCPNLSGLGSLVIADWIEKLDPELKSGSRPKEVNE